MVAVTVDYASAFKNVGIDFSKLEGHGVKVALNTSGLKFSLDGEVLASIPIAPGKISELADHFDPGNQTHQTMKASLVSAVQGLEKKIFGTKPVPKPGMSGAAEAAANGPLSPTPAAVAMPAEIKVLPADKMKTDPMVKLADADKLFQPVQGTSAGSRYYVVGIGPGIRVAARFKKTQQGSGGQLSVRIEGKAFSKLAAKIQEAGVFGPSFAGSFKGDYASMHLGVDGKKETQRVIGAVLGSMAPYIGHPTPDLQPLVDAA